MNIDNRWPFHHEMTKNGFSSIKSTTPSNWLIDIANIGWMRIEKGIDAKTLKKHGFRNEDKPNDFMIKHGLTYITDCGTTIYSKHLTSSQPVA